LTDFQTGLVISVIGLLVTFFALGIFIGVMVLLQKLFPVKTKKEEKVSEETKPVEVVAQVETGAEEIAAALAAVTYLRSQRAGQLGASLLSGPGPYRTTR
jgi:Na+-transporting methylmalonyl-CoA/oxaloacetate decarboxylase gamma subunit